MKRTALLGALALAIHGFHGSALAQPAPAPPPPSMAPAEAPAPPSYMPPLAPSAPQPWFVPQPVRWASVDPLFPVGALVTATGVIALAPGIAALASSRGDSVCGLNGCVEPYRESRGGVAAGFFASSGAMLAVGIPTLVMGASGASPEAGARRSPRAAMLGAWLTGYGAGAAAYGLTTAFASPKGNDLAGTAIGVGAVGGAMLLAGVPLWIVGTRSVDVEERNPALEAPAKSEGRMYAGMALSALGTVTIASGVMAMAQLSSRRGDFAGYDVAFVGGSITLAGTVLLGIGLPLWLTGAGPRPRGKVSLLPTIAAGPTSVELQWRSP